MKLYAFDVDETLENSNGPVTYADLMKLRNEGNILGLCGNFAKVTTEIRGWDVLFLSLVHSA